MKRRAFVFYAHEVNDALHREIAKARAELPADCGIHVIAYFNDAEAIPAEFAESADFHPYLVADFDDMGYSQKVSRPFRLNPGNTDLPIIKFSMQHRHYDEIWRFEYDVRYTGHLGDLVAHFAASDSDLICTNIRTPPPGWGHFPAWEQADLSSRTSAFLPACRISRKLIDAIDQFYRHDGYGHYEYIWPYVALKNGMTIEDFGGSGKFTRQENKNRFYTSTLNSKFYFPGTFRYRPSFTRAGTRKNTLYHPVKIDQTWRSIVADWWYFAKTTLQRK